MSWLAALPGAAEQLNILDHKNRPSQGDRISTIVDEHIFSTSVGVDKSETLLDGTR
jgi:hypothetical protein